MYRCVEQFGDVGVDGCLPPYPHPTLLPPRAAIERFALNVEAFAFFKASLLRHDQNAYTIILRVDAPRTPHPLRIA
uniref:Uncharacterized protein n=1 Tax=Xanthomonas citri pv. phaseoli var. fuscans TaxID=473423 RepID=A0AB33F239_XANCI